MLIVITNTERIGDVMKIGDISIHYLNGGNTKMDGGAMFGVVPKPLWSKQYNANERNQINLPTHPILIQTAQYNLIIDAGIGNGKLSEKQLRNFGVDEESHIIADLANYNLTPKDIDFVLMTHMHFRSCCRFDRSRDMQFLKMRFMLCNKMSGMSLLHLI